MIDVDVQPMISDLLTVKTPDAWLDYAIRHLDALLIDHAMCEKKAASTALSMMYRYTDKPDLLHYLSRLAREELRHFEQVLNILAKRQIAYCPEGPGRYAASLHQLIRKAEPYRLVDTLIVGAFIEARSCERFERLSPLLDEVLQGFYHRLYQSEKRHFQQYLTLAKRYSDEAIQERIDVIAAREAELITSVDQQFRFHSGPVDTTKF